MSFGELLINAFVEVIIWELGGSFDLSWCLEVKNDRNNMENPAAMTAIDNIRDLGFKIRKVIPAPIIHKLVTRIQEKALKGILLMKVSKVDFSKSINACDSFKNLRFCLASGRLGERRMARL